MKWRNHYLLSALACTILCSIGQASVVDTTSGLLYHLDAGIGVTSSGGAVSAWNDANANGNNFTQSSAPRQPTLISADAAFNNQPAIRFDGDLTGSSNGIAPNADRLDLSSSTANIQTVFIVNSTFQHRGLDGIWGLSSGDTGIRRHDASSWQTPSNGGNPNDFPTSMYINGVLTPNASLNTPVIMTAFGNATLSATSLGDYFQVGTVTPRPWNGDIAEIAVYNRALTTTERQNIESYLGAKYGIAVPEPSTLVLAALGGIALLCCRRRSCAVN